MGDLPHVLKFMGYLQAWLYCHISECGATLTRDGSSTCRVTLSPRLHSCAWSLFRSNPMIRKRSNTKGETTTPLPLAGSNVDVTKLTEYIVVRRTLARF